jgi:ubiquinone/menaquinone biosynthesis C-methylase UbiE
LSPDGANLEAEPARAEASQERVTAYFDSQAQYWKEIYVRQDAFSVTYQQRMATVLAWIEQLALPSGSRILETGCGAGFTTLALAARGYQMEAQDVASKMAEQTRRHAEEAGLGNQVRVSAGEVHRLAFPDNTFPLVLAIGVLPWISAPAVAVRELTRVVQPGGFLLFTTDNRWRLHYLFNPARSPLLSPLRSAARMARRLLGRDASSSMNRLYSLRQTDSFVTAAGLEKIKSKTLGFGPFRFFNYRLFSDSRGIKIHEKLQSMADRGAPLLRATGGQYLVLARKPLASDPARDR